MLQSVPQIGRSKPRLLAHFDCDTFLVIQVVGPQTLYISETDNALMQTDDSGIIDALQIVQGAAGNQGIVTLWWKGDLWAAGSTPFKPLIIIPGASTGSETPTGEQPYGLEATA